MTGIWIDRTNDGRKYKDFRKIKDLKEISGFLSKKQKCFIYYYKLNLYKVSLLIKLSNKTKTGRKYV